MLGETSGLEAQVIYTIPEHTNIFTTVYLQRTPDYNDVNSDGISYKHADSFHIFITEEHLICAFSVAPPTTSLFLQLCL